MGTTAEKYFEAKISIREFLVDFFGALMPGMIFLILFVVSFLFPVIFFVQTLICILDKSQDTSGELIDVNYLEVIEKMPLGINVILFFLFLIFGYVFGTLFYRCDPKEPDYKSFLKIVKTFTEENHLKNWVVQVKYTKTDDIKHIKAGEVIKDPQKVDKSTVDISQVQFPYNNLKAYLLFRGRKDLADLIKWKVENQGKHELVNQRSKIFINALKIRLQFYFPEQCSTIIKNEAHIRLSSSMWYVSKSLKIFSSLGVLFAVLGGVPFYLLQKDLFTQNLLIFFAPLSLSILTFIFAWRIKIGIKKFFHYQRVREIFFVLETAHTAAKLHPSCKDAIFEGL